MVLKLSAYRSMIARLPGKFLAPLRPNLATMRMPSTKLQLNWYSQSSNDNINKNSKQNGGKNSEPEEYKPEVNPGVHPLALVAVLSLAYGLVWSLNRQREGAQNYEKLMQEEKDNNRILMVDDRILVFVVGGPSSGKTTLSKEIADKLGYTYLSPGELINNELKDPYSQYGKLVANCLRDGVNVPLHTLLVILRSAMAQSKNSKFLIDGFPRKMEQALKFQDEIFPPSLVVYLECPYDEMLNRFQKLSKDIPNEEVLSQRAIAFSESSERMLRYFKRVGKLVTVSCLNDQETIINHVKKVILDLEKAEPIIQP